MISKAIKFTLLIFTIIFLGCGISFAADTNLIKDSSLSSSKPTSLSQDTIFKASSPVKNYVDKNGKLPNYVSISGYKYSMPEYLYLISKSISLKSSNSKSQVNVKYGIKNPTKPTGNSKNYVLSKSAYVTMSKNVYKYIEKHNIAPNYASTSKGKIQYQTLIFGLSKIGVWYYKNKKLPTSVKLETKYTKSINKYIPIYKTVSSSSNNDNPSSSNPIENGKVKFANKNAIWVHSGDMKNVDLKTLASNGIGNVFLHEAVFKEFGQDNVLAWIKNANSLGVKTHIWFTVFYNTTSKNWINPIDVSTEKYNYDFFNSIVSRATSYSKMDGVSGIHLDYLRYPGTAYKYSYSNGVTGANAVTEFTKLLYNSVKKVNPKILLSAAVMPEASNNAYYYGQDTKQLGNYLDVIVPMIYKGNYVKDSTWIRDTAKWFAANSNGAEVWAGLQTYQSDSNVVKLSSSELTTDCKAALNGGSNGIALFRWGLVNILNLLKL